MSKANEPAFPVFRGDLSHYACLTKREYVAAMAMQGILASPAMRQLVVTYGVGKEAEIALAKCCISLADALLAELEK
jgi:hypothetical protein